MTVAEREAEFGGRSRKEAQIKGLSSWSRVKDYRLFQLQRMANVNLYPGSDMDAAMIADMAADHVILATGAVWRGDGSGRTRLEPISGFIGQALTPDDILAGAEVTGPVVIYDDDHYYMANALAADLAAKGHAVHLVSPQPTIAPWMGHTLEQPRIIAELCAAGGGMTPNAAATGWQDGFLTLVRSDTGETLPDLAAQTLIMVGTCLPDPILSLQLDQLGIPHRVIGDAECPGTLQSAVFSGHRHAREILGTEPADRIFKRERPTLFL